KPVGQVDDHARKETGFRQSQKEASRVELPRGVHESREDRDDAPRDHDPRNPLPGAPALDDQSAGNFKQYVSDVKHPDPKPVYAIAKPKVGAHSQIGE